MASIRSWTQIWPFFVRLCILNLVLDFKIIALADDSGSSGFAAQNTCKNTNYQSFLPPPYQNISHMTCTPVWHTYELRYIQKDHTTTIILSAPYTIGWVGIGFSKDGMMVGSSAMVGWINKHGHANIKQFYLRGRKPSEVIADKGELPLNNVPAAVATSGAEIHLAFQLQMTTPFERQPILLAFGSKYPQNHHLSKHEDETAIVFDFSAGSKDSASNELIQMRKNHGIVGIIGWGLILPVGAIVARYFRNRDPLWFYFHAVIQFVGFTFGLVTVLLGLQLYSKMHVHIPAHRGIGIFALVLSILQILAIFLRPNKEFTFGLVTVLLGLQLYSKMHVHIPAHRGIGIFALVLSILQILAIFLRPNKESKIRNIWNCYHSWFGRLALFFAAINIVLGMQAAEAGSDWKIGYGFLVSIIVVASIVREVLAYLKRSEMRILPPNFHMDPVEEATFPSNQAKR